MAGTSELIDFDDYADDYEQLLQEQLGFFSKDRDYFPSLKVDLTARLCPTPPARVLDFGCGIGLTLPHLRLRFPQASLYATDVSAKSLVHVGKNYPDVAIRTDAELDGETFDLVFISCVFHHIRPEERPPVVARLHRLLNAGGTVCIFEHNPLNPVTRRIVASCPFDADAELLTRGELRSLLAEGGFSGVRGGYCLFVPPALKWLRPLERFLGWLPLGGQYVMAASKAR